MSAGPDQDAIAVCRAQQRLSGTVLDVGVTPARVAEIGAEIGLDGLRVQLLDGVGGQVAFASHSTMTVAFAPSALWLPIVLHELAHLVVGGPGHDEAFVAAFVELLVRYGSADVGCRFWVWVAAEQAGVEAGARLCG